MVYNMYVLPRMGYYAQNLTSPLKDMREKPDKPIQNLLRNISSKMSSFPTKLLYIPINMSGLEFKCPTDTIRTTKRARIDRVQLQLKDSASIIAGMRMRPQRHQQPQ